MNITVKEVNNIKIAIIDSSELLLTDTQSALDLIAAVSYESGCSRMIVDKSAIDEPFFQLSTKIAGEILQKYINYHMKLAVVGDFSGYTSKSLKDFIYESNNGRDIFFLNTKEEAIAKLSV